MSQATDFATAVEHGIRINEEPSAAEFLASCRCGFKSSPAMSLPLAQAAGAVHLTHVPELADHSANALLVAAMNGATYTTDGRWTLPPVACAPWCVDGDGHPQGMHPSEQRCFGAELRSPATLHPAAAMSDGTVQDEYVTVYGQRDPGRPAHVVIGRGESDTIELTPDEARQVVEHVQLVLGQVEVTRISHCSCGRPAREVLDGGTYGPTGYCGAPFRPLDPCNCGSVNAHDNSVCHIYGKAAGVAGSVGGEA